MQKQDETHPLRSIIVPLVIGGVIILVIMVCYGSLMDWLFTKRIDLQGQFGDQYGALNTLFSGMAFIGLAVTIFYQSRDLRAQTKALNLQQEALQQQITEFKEQKEEMQRSAEAQESANNLAKIALIVEVGKLRIDLMMKRSDRASNNSGGRGMLDSSEDLIAKLEQRFAELISSIGDVDSSGDLSPKMH